MGVTTVGVGCLSVEPCEDEKFRAHHDLLEAVVKPWIYYFTCLPPKLAGAIGASARATLVSDGQGGSTA
jgi:kynurenine formamidase